MKNLNFVILCLTFLCSGINAGTLLRELVLEGTNGEIPVELEQNPIQIQSISDDIEIPVAFKTIERIAVVQEQDPVLSENVVKSFEPVEAIESVKTVEIIEPIKQVESVAPVAVVKSVVTEDAVLPEVKPAEVVVVDVVESVKSINPEVVAIEEVILPVQSENRVEQLVAVDAEVSPSVKTVVAEIIENDSSENIIGIESVRQAQIQTDQVPAAVVSSSAVAPAPGAAAPVPAAPAQPSGLAGVIQNLIQNNPLTQVLNLNRPQATAPLATQVDGVVVQAPVVPARPSFTDQVSTTIQNFQQSLANTFGVGQNNNPNNQATSNPQNPSILQNIQNTFSNIINGGQQNPTPAASNGVATIAAGPAPASQGPLQSFVSTITNLVNNRVGAATVAPATVQAVPILQAAPPAPVVETNEVKEIQNSIVPAKLQESVVLQIPVQVIQEKVAA